MADMESTFKVYETRYVLGIGAALVIVTAEPAKNGSLRSEFHILLWRRQNCIHHSGALRMWPKDAIGAQVVVTEDLLLSLGKTQAEAWLEEHLQETYDRLLGYPDPFVLQETDGPSSLRKMRFSNRCTDGLDAVQDKSLCGPLVELLASLKAIKAVILE
jgi:hypothetical protein